MSEDNHLRIHRGENLKSYAEANFQISITFLVVTRPSLVYPLRYGVIFYIR